MISHNESPKTKQVHEKVWPPKIKGVERSKWKIYEHMEIGNQSIQYWQMDTIYPIKEVKIKNSLTKFIIKTFTSTCVAEILPKLWLQDQRLWEIMGSTNVNNLHTHEVVGSLCPVWTPILSRLSSSSYIQSMKTNYTFSFFFVENNHGPCHVWATWVFLSFCLPYLLWKAMWFSLFICSSSWSCCSKFEVLFDGPYLCQVSRVCFNFSQLYCHSLCPCNSYLCNLASTCVLA